MHMHTRTHALTHTHARTHAHTRTHIHARTLKIECSMFQSGEMCSNTKNYKLMVARIKSQKAAIMAITIMKIPLMVM